MLTNTQMTFENEILDNISSFLGKSVGEMADYFYIKPNVTTQKFPKNLNGMIVKGILNYDLDDSVKENFKQFNVTIRSIQLSDNGTIKESMPLTDIDFIKIVNEEWEDSELKDYLQTTRYLFTIFRKNEKGNNQLIGAKFWSMPKVDLEGKVKKAWMETVETLVNGVHLDYNLKRKSVSNNFITKSDNLIIHVRPRAAKSSYIPYSSNARQLPKRAVWSNKPNEYSSEWMTKQCFWLNNNYLADQLVSYLI
ncbi:MutH/Sau3AI family endonuclease [Weissella viridescens]|uniref:MutH/Sau3AI family endonuclease n=2 Tax=Weissella viridescens TaxID=1629 RepID=UPI0022E5BA8A|nr:MutH/Sau3AI family endonuclease [Weissella viridescens]